MCESMQWCVNSWTDVWFHGLTRNSYSRKMVGYLYAIQHGAEVVYETDDDNGFKPDMPLTNFLPQRAPVMTLAADPTKKVSSLICCWQYVIYLVYAVFYCISLYFTEFYFTLISFHYIFYFILFYFFSFYFTTYLFYFIIFYFTMYNISYFRIF
jgi:hypothetical protein